MPFGLTPAPRLATKILQPVIRHLRSMGVRVVVYIDDLLVLARSQEESLRHTQLLVDTLHHFGFSVHPDKIQAVPTRSIEFLGIQVNSALMQFRVPKHKIRDLRREITLVRAQHEAGELTLRRYSSLIGKFQCRKRSRAVSPTSHLAASASPELPRGPLVEARRDGQLERPLHDSRPPHSRGNDRCKFARLGRVVATGRHQASPRRRSPRRVA